MIKQTEVVYLIPTDEMSVAVFYHLIKPALLDNFVFVSKETRPLGGFRNQNLIIDLSIVEDRHLIRQILLTHRSLENNVVILGKINEVNSTANQIAGRFYEI